MKKASAKGETVTLEKELKELYDMYCDMYGMDLRRNGEYWFLPFPEESNLLIFKKDKKSFYHYSYNQNLVPDTQLTTTDTHDLLLSYNSIKAMKLFFGSTTQISNLRLNMFFNPLSHAISGTTVVDYKKKAFSRDLSLDNNIRLVSNLDQELRGLNVFRKQDRYYLLGAENNSSPSSSVENSSPNPRTLNSSLPLKTPVIGGPGKRNIAFFPLENR